MAEIKTDSKETLDSVYNGRLLLRQPLKGYRYSVDALLLTYFVCQGKKAEIAVDMGTGAGVIGLGLLVADQVKAVTGVEVQQNLAALAEKNAELNHLSSSFTVVRSDVRSCHLETGTARFDLVVANPPFWPADAARVPADECRRIACHDLLGDIRQWAEAASRLLRRRRGRFSMVFPARRLDVLFYALNASGLSASRLQLVYPKPDTKAELVLVESRFKEGGHLDIEPPMVLKEADGRDTKLLSSIVDGRFSDALYAVKDKRSRSVV